MNTIYAILVSFMLIACGDNSEETQTPSVPALVTIDVDLNEFVEEFMAECYIRQSETCLQNYPNLISVEFEDHNSLAQERKSDNIAGVCGVKANGERSIRISDKFLKNKAASRAIVFHEMGHCLLGLDHIDSGIHIMNTTMNFSVVYANPTAWDTFVDALFEVKESLHVH